MSLSEYSNLWFKYRVELAMGSDSYVYAGDTVTKLHEAIDADKRLDNDLEMRAILKRGYFGEFIDYNYHNKDYVIDNCMHFMWIVKEKKYYL